MDHLEATQYLTELVEGALAASLRDRVAEHVRDCSACQSWVATYRRLDDGLEAAFGHPGAGALAEYAVEPADLAVDQRVTIEDHLRQCRNCAREHRYARQALHESRPATRSGLGSTPLSGAAKSTWTAAGLLAATLVVAVLLLPGRTPESSTLKDTVVRDHRIVEADRPLVTGNTRLASSSDLELRAPEGVVLGDGFAVSRGARLRINSGQRREVAR